MTNVSKTAFNSIKYAQQNNFDKLLSIPMKDGSSAKLMWNADRADCFILKSGKIQGAQGFVSKNNFAENMGALLEKLQKNAKDGFDVIKEYINSAHRIVK